MVASFDFLSVARDITLGSAADALDGAAFTGAKPRIRFLAACLRLEAMGSAEGASARRIYARTSLSDEIAVPDAKAAARIIRILNTAALSDPSAADQARIAIAAMCDVLAPIDGVPV